ncbi:uncharacterized protein APUU_21107A [Aspergillus puulaauensis]|uniref:Uncharacterized protein n=1 Tax=Aspergillus puulaauensis TaxID=1220207 RepID=A0A7R7XFW2_9EURO|nr:uncharacterized protein APUU_21107A [Aspergillus puulaauensis]BCS20675.1 hypothetical protein APUU_21107A [Aspergillus puulaauensis]
MNHHQSSPTPKRQDAAPSSLMSGDEEFSGESTLGRELPLADALRQSSAAQPCSGRSGVIIPALRDASLISSSQPATSQANRVYPLLKMPQSGLYSHLPRSSSA